MPKKPGSGRTKKQSGKKKSGKKTAKKAAKKTGKKKKVPEQTSQKDIHTDVTIRRERIHDEKTTVKKKPIGKKPAKKKAAKKKVGNLAFAKARDFKKLCNEALKKANPNQQDILRDEYAILAHSVEPHRQHPELAKFVWDEANWGHINQVFTQLDYWLKEEFESEKEKHLAGARGLTFRWAQTLNLPKSKWEAFFSVLKAEFNARPTKRVLFDTLQNIWGEKFTAKYHFSKQAKAEDLPELELKTRRFPPKKK